MSTPISILSGRHLLARHRWNSRRRVASNEEEADAAAANDAEEGSFINNNNRGTTSSATAHGEDDSPAVMLMDDDEINNSQNNNNPATSSTSTVLAGTDTDHRGGDRVNSETPPGEEVDDEDDEEAVAGIHRFTVRPTMTLAELEEERELARRRSSACILFALFVLFRLWILALQDGDFGLLLLCLVGTSWAARWIRYNRDQEEELDRRIAAYLDNNNSNGGNESNNRHGVGRDDMRMLSFQAQLALAIMESQRQMMEGGYGHPDGEHLRAPGVSEQAKGLWTKFFYKAARDKVESRRGSYGSVAQEDNTTSLKMASDEEPHCSICLGEYEEGEELVKLPCSHIYHDECIRSWTQHHIRCPLCNYDLETAGAEEAV